MTFDEPKHREYFYDVRLTDFEIGYIAGLIEENISKYPQNKRMQDLADRLLSTVGESLFKNG